MMPPQFPSAEISATAKLEILGVFVAGIGVKILFDTWKFDSRFWFNFFDIIQARLLLWQKHVILVPYAMGFKAEVETAGVTEIVQRVINMLKGPIEGAGCSG